MSRFKDACTRNLNSFAIFAVALAVRLLHVWQLRASPFFTILMGDSRGYDEWAQRIAGGEWLGHEVFYQAPLYPYFLGVIYATAGRHLLLVRIVQAVIGSVSCVLLGLAAMRIFSAGRDPLKAGPDKKWIGLVAGLMLALYAPAIFFDGLIQKSVLDEFFVCMALWLIAIVLNTEPAKPEEKISRHSLRTLRPLRSTPWPWLWLGLTMGGLALTRENALVFILVILFWIIANGLRATGLGLSGQGAKPGAESSGLTGRGNQARPAPSRQPLAPTLTRAAVFLSGLALVLAPVAARNAYVGGGFFITTSQFGPNLYIGNHAGADGTYESLRFGRGAPEYERQDATELAERAVGRRLAPAEVSSYWADRAIDFATSQPGAWLRLMGRKALLLVNATEMLDTESQESYAEWSLPLRIGAPLGHFGILIPLALFGLVVTWPMRSRLWILYLMTLGYAASVVVFYVFARYRYPLAPFLILFAAAGGVAMPAVMRVRKLPGGAWLPAAIGAAVILTNWPILSADSMRAITESNLGVALQSDQRVAEAIPHYQRAIAFRPDYAPVYSNMASALRASGRGAEAIATYQHALALQPDFPDAHYNLANALLDAGQTDAAIEHFQIAQRSLPGSVDIETNLGIALATRGQLDAAIGAFRAALAIDPNATKARRNLGDVLAAAGRPDEAIEQLRAALALDPNDESAHYDLGSLLLERQNLDGAVAEFRAALKLSPNAVEVHNNLGIALGSQGKLDAAIDQFQLALTIEPTNQDALKNLAMARLARTRSR